jgi:hypothetical protein
MKDSTPSSTHELLDILEAGLVRYIQKNVPMQIDDKQARNLLGKIGTRLVFGKEVFDYAVTPHNPSSSRT